MTRSNKSEINLKSTAYNQTGQNYFQQLTAYNSMNAHLRRILLAKCVVDDRNKDYMYKRKQISKQNECKLQHLRINDTNNMINRLPYNTVYHPMSFLRMYYDSRYLHSHDAQKDNANSYNYDVVCARSKLYNRVMCTSSSTVKSNDQESHTSNIKNLKLQSSTSSKKIFTLENAKNVLKIHDGGEEKSVNQNTGCEVQSCESNNFSSTISTSKSYVNNECTQACANRNDSSEVYVKNAELKYAKFVYDITQEIILNGLYTDKELQEVFEKHIEGNKKFLDMNRMLYEIYQLKIALYLSDNLEDFTYTEQPANTSTLCPPMPSKVFNENQTTEKLSCHKKLEGLACKLSPINNKCVELIDANPELLVTDGDVNPNINPEHAQQIYKSLSDESKNTKPLTEAKVKSIKDEFLIDEQSGNSVYIQ